MSWHPFPQLPNFVSLPSPAEAQFSMGETYEAIATIAPVAPNRIPARAAGNGITAETSETHERQMLFDLFVPLRAMCLWR